MESQITSEVLARWQSDSMNTLQGLTEPIKCPHCGTEHPANSFAGALGCGCLMSQARCRHCGVAVGPYNVPMGLERHAEGCPGHDDVRQWAANMQNAALGSELARSAQNAYGDELKRDRSHNLVGCLECGVLPPSHSEKCSRRLPPSTPIANPAKPTLWERVRIWWRAM